MKTTNYKITLEGSTGASYAQYEDGTLRMFINEWSKFTEPPRAIPVKEKYLLAMHGAEINVAELRPRSVADKVALFCLRHKELLKFTYRPMKAEKANMKDVTVNDEYLKLYFTNNDFPLNKNKSMADYVRHYNVVRNLAINGLPDKVKSRFPDVYDREFERSLEGETLAAYWEHLRNKGWRKVDGVWINY
jgi:hypothetical protein